MINRFALPQHALSRFGKQSANHGHTSRNPCLLIKKICYALAPARRKGRRLSNLAMLSIVRSGRRLLICLCLTAGVACAAEQPPTSLRVPVVGVRYAIASAPFDRFPDSVMSMCPSLAADENMHGVFWTYATARDGDAVYYVIGGYGIRTKPNLPDFPRYELQDLGTVVQIRGQNCVVLGEAKEVFLARYFDEIPQRALQSLAEDLARQLAVAFGGLTKMRAELRRQHVDVDNISPEVSKAFAAGR